MPHCPCNVVDASCLSADQTGENLLEHIEAWQMCIWITDVSWASTTILNNTKNCEFLLWSISSHKKEIGKRSASAWPFQATRKYVRHWGHYRICMDSVATLTLQRWPQTITFSPLLAAEEGWRLFLGGNTWFCLKVEEDYWQRLRLHGKINVQLVNSMKWKCEALLCG
jgi:hypothetical protein